MTRLSTPIVKPEPPLVHSVPNQSVLVSVDLERILVSFALCKNGSKRERDEEDAATSNGHYEWKEKNEREEEDLTAPTI